MKPDGVGDKVARAVIWMGVGILIAAYASRYISSGTSTLMEFTAYAAVPNAPAGADLGAQRSMARAAWAMFYSSTFQAIIGGIGLFALVATLRHSAKANAISERTAQIQLAPYLRCNFRHLWHFDQLGNAIGISVTPSWTNVGQTLALNVAIHTNLQGVEPSRFGSELHFGLATLEGAIRSNLGPGGVIDGAVLTADRQDVLDQLAGRTRGVIYSSAWFTDSFGARHFTSVCFAPVINGLPSSPEDNMQGGVIYHTYPHGNWYQVDRDDRIRS